MTTIAELTRQLASLEDRLAAAEAEYRQTGEAKQAAEELLTATEQEHAANQAEHQRLYSALGKARHGVRDAKTVQEAAKRTVASLREQIAAVHQEICLAKTRAMQEASA